MDSSGLLCLEESSSSTYLFQKTLSYEVCSKDAKLPDILEPFHSVFVDLQDQQVHAFIYWRKTA